MVGPDGDGAAELAQQAADGVEAGGAGGQPSGAQAVQAVRACWGTDLTGTEWMLSLR